MQQPGTCCSFFLPIERTRATGRRCHRYQERLSEQTANQLQREIDKDIHVPELVLTPQINQVIPKEPVTPVELPAGIEFTVAEPITDRKSVFIGRACRITHYEQVPVILAYLMADKRIARLVKRVSTLDNVFYGLLCRAAHPIINAWRCTVDGIMHQGMETTSCRGTWPMQ